MSSLEILTIQIKKALEVWAARGEWDGSLESARIRIECAGYIWNVELESIVMPLVVVAPPVPPCATCERFGRPQMDPCEHSALADLVYAACSVIATAWDTHPDDPKRAHAFSALVDAVAQATMVAERLRRP